MMANLIQSTITTALPVMIQRPLQIHHPIIFPPTPKIKPTSSKCIAATTINTTLETQPAMITLRAYRFFHLEARVMIQRRTIRRISIMITGVMDSQATILDQENHCWSILSSNHGSLPITLHGRKARNYIWAV